MVTAAASTQAPAGARDRGFHPLVVARVVRETADASSFVLTVPAELRDSYAYRAGQFCTFRATVGGAVHLRCYSMSSSPATDAELQVTVKRVAGGVVSNWMNDELHAGDVIEVAPPAGAFLLGDGEGDVVAFSGGSGITPVFSIVKTALATTSRNVRVLYANRDRDAVIFADALTALEAEHGDRLTVIHHLDVEHGFVDADTVAPLARCAGDADFFVCGPGPFMDVVERGLVDAGADTARVHIERFVAAAPPPVDEPAAPPGGAVTEVTIELDGRVATAQYRKGTTILQTARQLGMSPPFSCESGSCATCMAKLTEGSATMRVDNALTPDEVADGWVLTCQAEPTSPVVHVVYGYEEG